jgi:hypothetical protein
VEIDAYLSEHICHSSTSGDERPECCASKSRSSKQVGDRKICEVDCNVEWEHREHLSAIVFELEAYPEPKILNKAEMKSLIAIHGTTVAVAKFLGCSQSHVWERLSSQRGVLT